MRQFNAWSASDERRYLFYRQFISNGDIVFDVGANVGNRTKVFLKLHAQVIGFEPQYMCAEFLTVALKNNENFTLVKKALGSEVGEAQMLVSDTHTISSMSSKWVESVTRSGRFGNEQWKQRQLVEMTTLDCCIKEYGHPTFMKIDVEGYEYEVLSGLTKSIGVISIEFTPEYIENTFKCIDHLCSLSDEVEFQISLGESMEWYLPAWVSKAQIKVALLKLDARKFGDIYIKSARIVNSATA